MDNLLSIALEAHNAEQNHHRYYSFTVGRDLLGDWSVCIRYGRVGRRGQEVKFAGDRIEPLQAIIRERLKKRLSARRRIGCDYRLTKLDVAPGLDGKAWLPNSMLMPFF